MSEEVKPFGYSYFLDMYNTAEGTADDLELVYRFLERLVDEIGMTRMTPPIVIHGPTDNGREIYADKYGVSGWVGLIESGIQIHAIEAVHFISLDVYSCSSFKPETVLEFARKHFGFDKYEEHFLKRGLEYHNQERKT
jgi:S-adenosylmethionine/arginine decarboxylase-like enzyme